jgi:hypothetical protein
LREGSSGFADRDLSAAFRDQIERYRELRQQVEEAVLPLASSVDGGTSRVTCPRTTSLSASADT